MVRVLRWLGIRLLVLLAACAGVVLTALNTRQGRDWVRDRAVGIASRKINGSLQPGNLSFGPGCRIRLDTATMRDTEDSLLVASGPIEAQCDLGSLLRGRFVLL